MDLGCSSRVDYTRTCRVMFSTNSLGISRINPIMYLVCAAAKRAFLSYAGLVFTSRDQPSKYELAMLIYYSPSQYFQDNSPCPGGSTSPSPGKESQ
jgi:hypothetical protein